MGASFNLPEHPKDIGRNRINVLTGYQKWQSLAKRKHSSA
jgi:hypothetical protein